MDSRRDVSPCPEIRLDAGQTVRLPVAAGTVLLACAGALRVDEAPRWLGERWVTVSQRLADGQVLVARDAGWVTVGAVGEAGGCVRRIDPEPSPGRAGVWLRLLASRRRRLAPVR